MYGENGEVEYGGDMKNANSPTRQLQDHSKHYFSGMPPEIWAEHGISLSDLNPFWHLILIGLPQTIQKSTLWAITNFGILKRIIITAENTRVLAQILSAPRAHIQNMLALTMRLTVSITISPTSSLA